MTPALRYEDRLSYPTSSQDMPAAATGPSAEAPAEDAVYHQQMLLVALESANLTQVRAVLSSIPEALRTAVLLLPSKRIERKLRTPLMAGAATGDMAIVGVSLYKPGEKCGLS